LSEQLRRTVEVIQVTDLDGAVHVAIRDANHGRCHAVARQLDHVRVCPGRARCAADLYGDFERLCSFLEPLGDARVDVRPAVERWPATHLALAELLLLVPRRVGRVANVDRDADRRMNAVSARGGPAKTYLLLYGRDRVDLDRKRFVAQQ